ncbi:hypothetical protein DFS34DRAFT_614118 [Phlyctochytrium arcticum]|nr:hypothetical protein DFS34DRAFT_614118 [Phlyctochytrium arcticum]
MPSPVATTVAVTARRLLDSLPKLFTLPAPFALSASAIQPVQSEPAPGPTSLPLAERVATTLLEDANCCPRCVLRFFGTRNHQAYSSLQTLSDTWALQRSSQKRHLIADEIGEKAEAHGNEKRQKLKNGDAVDVPVAKDQIVEDSVAVIDTPVLAPTTAPSPHTCPVCLGLLHGTYMEVAERALALFKEQGYALTVGKESFVLHMRLPPQLAIRSRAVRVLLEEHFKDELPGEYEPIEVKEVFRNLMVEVFEGVFKIPYQSDSPFSITINFSHPQTTEDYMFMTKIKEADFNIKKSRQKRKIVVHGASLEKITKAVDKLSFAHFKSAGMVPPPPVSAPVIIEEVSLFHTPIFVAGRYLKLQRHISNSPWEIDGKLMTEHSVEGLIAGHVDECFRADGHRFYSSGREDADVLMLGKGRPFYLEVLNPRQLNATQEQITQLQREINEAAGGKVRSRDLQVVSRNETKVLKDAASTKSKSYTTLVKLSEPVTLEKMTEISKLIDLEVKQRNPTRVPRRADMVRDKVIENMKIYPAPETLTHGRTVSADGVVQMSHPVIDTPASATTGPDQPWDKFNVVRLDLRTSAGTYVKEFVHGDNGRTEPSLASLLGVSEAAVLELDVLEVHLDWPQEQPTDGDIIGVLEAETTTPSQ